MTENATLSATVSRDALAAELALCAMVCPKKNTIPILTYALLSVRVGVLSIRVTDLELAAYVSLNVLRGDDAEATIELSPLLGFVKSAPDDTVAIEFDGKVALLTSGTAKHKLPTLPAEDFPHDRTGHRMRLTVKSINSRTPTCTGRRYSLKPHATRLKSTTN